MLATESPFRDLLRLVVWHPLRWTLLALPIGAGLFVLRRMGDLHFLVSRGKKRHLARCLDNLGLGLSAEAVRREIRAFFQTHYIHQLSIFLFPKFNGGRLDRYLEFTGLERLDEARRSGRGAVIVLGHHGPTQAPLAALGALGYDIKQIGYPSDEGLSYIGRKVAFRLRLVYEGKIRAEIVRPGSDLRGLLRHLKNGGLVMTLGDGEGAGRRFGKYAPFPFFGHEAEFPLGAARLAQKAGALLFPLRLEPGDSSPFRAVIGEALSARNADRNQETSKAAYVSEEAAPLDAQGKDALEKEITSRFLDFFSEAVRARPGWWHFLERFHEADLLAPSQPKANRRKADAPQSKAAR